jgi:amidase
MSHEELAYMGAAEIADKVRRRLLSPVEIVDACIARIERRNPSLNAFVFNGFDDARREAKAAEGAIMSGVAVGPLHGVPSAIKDLFDFKPGWPFTFGGVRAMRNCVADWHCIFAERVEKAGAILLGKTNSPTMGLRGTCDNFPFGPTRNPFDLRKNAGGSSGGSAAAVADGLVSFAEAQRRVDQAHGATQYRRPRRHESFWHRLDARASSRFSVRLSAKGRRRQKSLGLASGG